MKSAPAEALARPRAAIGSSLDAARSAAIACRTPHNVELETRTVGPATAEVMLQKAMHDRAVDD